MNLLVQFVERLPRRGRAVFLTCAYGLLAGLAAVAFQVAMNALFRATFVSFARQKTLVFLFSSLAVISATSLAVGFLLTRFAPEASGSGIPQLKLAFWKDFGFVPFRVVWVKFLAGVLSIGGGCSLGREGPSVQLAGGLASTLSGVLGVAKPRRRMAAAAGAAAGLAAAFNTPLAAVTFVLEEIIADLNSSLLGSVLLASVIGAFVVHGLVGKQPAFALGTVESAGWWVYALTPLVAALAALVGVVFQKCSLGLRARRGKLDLVPPWCRPLMGGVITWALGSVVFLRTGRLGVFGLGYDDLSEGLRLNLSWQIAAVLLGAKLLATIACYGLGGCGGIFSPTLFLGGMCGICLGGIWSLAAPLSPSDQLTLAVVGMSACLGAVVRAPVTGILIVFEMTHEFSLVPALMLGALVSQALSRKMNHHSFYEEILLQDGHRLDHVVPPRDLLAWQQLPVTSIASLRPVVVLDSSPQSVGALLKSHPYQRFPVVEKGRLQGILTRKEAEAAIAEKRSFNLEPPVICLAPATIRELQAKWIDSTSLIVVVLDKPEGDIVGLITLHDLLRAEVSFARELPA